MSNIILYLVIYPTVHDEKPDDVKLTNPYTATFMPATYLPTQPREAHFHSPPKDTTLQKQRFSNVNFSRLVVKDPNEESLYAVIYPYYILSNTNEQGSPPGASPFNEELKNNIEYRNQFNINGIYYRKDSNGYAMTTNPSRKDSQFKAYQWLCMYNKDTFQNYKKKILEAMTKASSESLNTNLTGNMFIEKSDRSLGGCCRYCDVFVQEDLIEIFKYYLIDCNVASKTAQEIRDMLNDDIDFINYVKDVFGCNSIDQQLKVLLVSYW